MGAFCVCRMTIIFSVAGSAERWIGKAVGARRPLLVLPSRQEVQSHHKGEEKNRRSFDGAAAGASKEPRQVSLGFRGTRPPSPSVLLYGSRLHALRFKGTDATLQQVHGNVSQSWSFVL